MGAEEGCKTSRFYPAFPGFGKERAKASLRVLPLGGGVSAVVSRLLSDSSSCCRLRPKLRKTTLEGEELSVRCCRLEREFAPLPTLPAGGPAASAGYGSWA